MTRWCLGLFVFGLIFAHAHHPIETRRWDRPDGRQTHRGARQASTAAPALAGAARAQLIDRYLNLPVSFETNEGQIPGSAEFLWRGSAAAILLAPTEATLVLASSTRGDGVGVSAGETVRPPSTDSEPTRVRMRLEGGNAGSHGEGVDPRPGRSHYYLGADPAGWHTDVTHYAKVRYRDVYPGVDLEYYGTQRQLEYDFIVAPGGDPAPITLRFEGVDTLDLDADGDLLLQTPQGRIRQTRPVIYQDVGGDRTRIPGHYVLLEGDRVTFEIGSYDPALPLVIDPVVTYSTFFGGSLGDDVRGVGLDSTGNIYFVGRTFSANLLTLSAAQAMRIGTIDVFVTKLNSIGNGILYSTYLGG